MQRRTGKVPGPLKDRPELTDSNVYYWIAYCELSRKFASNSIPYAEIKAFSDLSGLNGTELMVKINAIEDALNGDNSCGTDGTDKS